MKGLKLWHKMALAFGAIIILMIIGGFISIQTASRLARYTSNLYQRPFAVSTAIRDIKNSLVEMDLGMKNIATDLSLERLEEDQNKMEEVEKKAFANFKLLDDRYVGDKTQIKKALALFESWKPIREKIIDQRKVQITNDANEVTRTEEAPHIEELKSALEGLVSYGNNKAVEERYNAKFSGKNAKASEWVERFYMYPYTVANTGKEIQTAVYQMVVLMKDLSVAPTIDDIENINSEIDEKNIFLGGKFDILKERYEGDKADLEKVENLFYGWRPIREKIYDLRVAQVSVNPDEVIRNESVPLLNELNVVLDRLVDHMDSKAKEFNDNASSSALFSEILLGIIFLAAAIIGIIAAMIATRSVINTVGGEPDEIAKVARDVAAGNFEIGAHTGKEKGIYAELLKMAESLKTAISSIRDVMDGVSRGDFTNSLTDLGMRGEMDSIKESINNSVNMLSETITQVVSATEQVNSGAGQISAAAQSLAEGTSTQAASLQEISSSMAEVGSRAKANNDNASQATNLTNQAIETADRGNSQMKEMLSSMKKINESSSNISKIIKVIDDIAFQTNLLALNAAVEAARAGKYGKGFAVVAEEVRNLAARSAEAAKNTTDLIGNSVKEVESGVSNAGKTASILEEINEAVAKVSDLVNEIAIASKEQSINTDEINRSLNQVNEIVQQNSSISEEAASASEELSGQSMELQALMSRFQLGMDGGQDFRGSYDVTFNHGTTEPEEAETDFTELPEEIEEDDKPDKPRMITLDDDEFGRYDS